MAETTVTAEIKSIVDLLGMELAIPDYQRPYKWTTKNMADLLNDIENAIEKKDSVPQSENTAGAFKYRIGTIILHRRKEDAQTNAVAGGHSNRIIFDIVDGQQRIISLLLILRYLVFHKYYAKRGKDIKAAAKKLKKFCGLHLSNKDTRMNLAANNALVEDWFRFRSMAKDAIPEALSNLLEVVVITVDELSEAFQLFDSQNARGRELDPHDLLKAYHLREMDGHPFEMQRAVKKWEAETPSNIKELFGEYLFPIIKWSNGDSSATQFTAQEIDIFKGIRGTSEYAYAARTRKAMPSFQITEPFIAGEDFFSMVDYYLELLKYLRISIKERFPELDMILIDDEHNWSKNVGFNHAKTLFECALLCYYDRFRNLDDRAVKKLFTWAFMLRVDIERLGRASVNLYAVGTRDKYSNACAMFSIIRRARLHNDISNLQISVKPKDGKAMDKDWNNLRDKLYEINNIRDESPVGTLDGKQQ